MMRTKARAFTPITALSLEELAPSNHFYCLRLPSDDLDHFLNALDLM
jgi:hypothetical protein